jgi:Family of unknown function (DUF6011)
MPTQQPQNGTPTIDAGFPLTPAPPVTNVSLTDDDRMWLSRWTVGRNRQPGMEWLASNPDADKVQAHLLADHLDTDPHLVYAENWPRKAAKLAADYRSRGEDPRADRLHDALVALMYCANCGRPLADPASIERGIGPDCWSRIDPAWRESITGRLAAEHAGHLF